MDRETFDNYIYIYRLHMSVKLSGDTNRWMVILSHILSTISTQVLIFYRTQFHIMKDKETQTCFPVRQAVSCLFYRYI